MLSAKVSARDKLIEKYADAETLSAALRTKASTIVWSLAVTSRLPSVVMSLPVSINASVVVPTKVLAVATPTEAVIAAVPEAAMATAAATEVVTTSASEVAVTRVSSTPVCVTVLSETCARVVELKSISARAAAPERPTAAVPDAAMLAATATVIVSRFDRSSAVVVTREPVTVESTISASVVLLSEAFASTPAPAPPTAKVPPTATETEAATPMVSTSILSAPSTLRARTSTRPFEVTPESLILARTSFSTDTSAVTTETATDTPPVPPKEPAIAAATAMVCTSMVPYAFTRTSVALVISASTMLASVVPPTSASASTIEPEAATPTVEPPPMEMLAATTTVLRSVLLRAVTATASGEVKVPSTIEARTSVSTSSVAFTTEMPSATPALELIAALIEAATPTVSMSASSLAVTATSPTLVSVAGSSSAVTELPMVFVTSTPDPAAPTATLPPPATETAAATATALISVWFVAVTMTAPLPAETVAPPPNRASRLVFTSLSTSEIATPAAMLADEPTAMATEAATPTALIDELSSAVTLTPASLVMLPPPTTRAATVLFITLSMSTALAVTDTATLLETPTEMLAATPTTEISPWASAETSRSAPEISEPVTNARVTPVLVFFASVTATVTAAAAPPLPADTPTEAAITVACIFVPDCSSGAKRSMTWTPFVSVWPPARPAPPMSIASPLVASSRVAARRMRPSWASITK